MRSAVIIKNMDLKKKLYRFISDISEEDIRLLELYLQELWRWNQKINLVGVSSYERLVDELLADSVISAEFVPEKGTLLDLGSGAGFPALPLKIIRPDVYFDLVEARSKKATFLRHIIRSLRLKNIRVIEKRIEDAKKELLSFYDIITFRGIELVTGLSLALPYLHKGLIVTFQGKNYKSLITQIAPWINNIQLKIHQIKEYTLAGKRRAILVFSRSF